MPSGDDEPDPYATVNLIDLGDHGGIPWNTQAPRWFLDRAVARKLNTHKEDE